MAKKHDEIGNIKERMSKVYKFIVSDESTHMILETMKHDIKYLLDYVDHLQSNDAARAERIRIAAMLDGVIDDLMEQNSSEVAYE